LDARLKSIVALIQEFTSGLAQSDLSLFGFSVRAAMIKKAIKLILVIVPVSVVIASCIATAISFPWNTDPQGDESLSQTRSFYAKAYSADPQDTKSFKDVDSGSKPLSEKEQFYVDLAQGEAKKNRIPEAVTEFVEKYNLGDKKVLEVGAGSGLLQDIVTDYTGLDISPSARRFFHKKFVEASATDMPFADNSFDGLWSIWVLEHIPNPEKALLEMRRVVKPGGYIFFRPAYEVDRYAAQGYRVRPYSDFDTLGKIKKSTIGIADSNIYHNLSTHQLRLMRALGSRIDGKPSRLHFIKLDANYDQYWNGDSDACTSVSYYEIYRWFTSRGDQCLNCEPEWKLVLSDITYDKNMILRVSK
jgi:SAM-dependent methyltransferase